MSLTDYVLIGAPVLLLGVFFNPRLLRSSTWQATVIPLASIIGSGFLVVGPILAHAAGTRAWVAMLALCGAGYLFGEAIRFNIRHIEPLLKQGAPSAVSALEHASQFALSLSYFVSVAYYLNLFAAFALRTGGVIDPFVIRVASTGVIASLGMIGMWGGLKALEQLAVSAVGLKVAIIGGLLAALAVAAATTAAQGDFVWPRLTHPHGFREMQILLGLVILVQGFETSRYLGSLYDADTRIRTMRLAQWISTVIYVSFILLITAHFSDGLPKEGGETAIIDMLQPIGVALAPMIIIAALSSQLSAAVADMSGAGGLLAQASYGKLRVGTANLLTAAIAIAIIWVADIFQIITYASRAFVIYYALQSCQAMLAAKRAGHMARAALFGAAIVLALVVIVFAIPADV